MFDPSKLDLDLEQNNKKNNSETLKQSESDKIAENKIQSQSKKIELISEGKDDLEDLLEETSSLNTSNTEPELKTEPTKENTLQEVKIDTNLGEVTSQDTIETKDYGTLSDNSYDKQKIIDSQKSEDEAEIEKKEKIIYDINIKSLQDIFNKLIEKTYDFVILEPFDNFVKISYRKDNIEIETLFIKYPVYTQILIKGKTLTHLKVDDVDSSQEGQGTVTLKSKGYKVLSKTAPGGYGEKMFLKLQEEEGIKKKVEKKPVSFTQILGFLGAALFAALVIGGGFLTFVLLNSNTVSDLTFFNSLGVDVGSIRDFTAKLVNTIFSIIILIESIFLFSFTFKALLTKKELKKQKIARSIFAIFFLILTFISGFVWITLSNKINDLKGQNYGKMLTYDNAKYLSNIFDEQGSLINIEESLIGPVTLRFDISEIINQLVNDNNYTPESVKWIIGGNEYNLPINDLDITHTFDTIDLHSVDLEIKVLNALGESEVITDTVAKINIENIVNINEKKVAGGGTIYQLDASNLKDLGKIEWFYIPDLNNLSDIEKTKTISTALKQAANTGYLFDSKILYDEELILGMKILAGGEESEELDKIFVFSGENNTDDIKADIKAEANINNPFEYTLNVIELETILGNATVESFLWKIGDQTVKKEVNLANIEDSSEINHTFPSYGTFTIYLDIIDSRGNTQTIEKEIIIQKRLELSQSVIMRNGIFPIDNLDYNEKLHEYIIDEIGIPTTISLDARFIKSADTNYVSRNVEWDFDGDSDIDSTEDKTDYNIDYEGRHHIIGNFYFEHRKKPEDVIIVREDFYIEGIKKEAQISFDIKQDSQYAPVIVSLDASRSQVKDENIVKFEWFYGDETEPEVRDAIVQGHKYNKAGDYEIKLIVTTESGKTYTTSKKLILQPKPQDIEITTSMKTAPTYQEIDFLSDKSAGQISSYFWDFGDGGTSIKANPSHQYTKPGTYEVELRLDFVNNNVLKEKIEIVITDD